MKVALYVEGGGTGKALRTEARRGFSDLLKGAGFAGRLPRVVACGSRNEAYDRFRIRFSAVVDEYSVLLVDSEDVVAHQHRPDVSSGAWQHLRSHDGWTRPYGSGDDQAQLMVTCMETWLLADREALRSHFPKLNEKRLLPVEGLEGRTKQDVQAALRDATASSRKGRYDKARDSFTLVGKVSPDALRRSLPHFRKFLEALDSHL